MAILTMPGPACPAPPAFGFDVPDSWQPQVTSGALMDLVFGADPDGGRLTVRHLVLASADLVAQVIDGYRAETERDGGVVDQPFALTVGGRSATGLNAADDQDPHGPARVVTLGFFDPAAGADGVVGRPSGAAASADSAAAPVSGLIIIGAVAGPGREDRYAEIRDMILSASFGRLVRADGDTQTHDDIGDTTGDMTDDEVRMRVDDTNDGDLNDGLSNDGGSGA